MKVRTRSQQLKWRLQPRRGRNTRMDALLRRATGPQYSAGNLVDRLAAHVRTGELEFEPQPANISLRSANLT